MKNPWMKFYPPDWRADPALRMCSLAARGLWVELIALMHDADPYGHLVVGGRTPTDAQIAMLAGASVDDVRTLLGELEAAGVFSRSGKGVIFSRRMVRDEKKSKIAQKNGKSGGNPSLSKQKEIQASDNQTSNQEEKGPLKTQKPEARNQKPEARSQTIPPTPHANDQKQTQTQPSAVEIGLECLSICGADPTPWQMGSKSFSQVSGWLGAGYTTDEITAVFRANKDRLSGKDNPLAYAAKILPEAIEARRIAAQATEDRATNPADWQQVNGRPLKEWRFMYSQWVKDGFWPSHWGPAPNHPETSCPVSALAE